MDWTKKMPRKDLVRFLETMYRELAEDVVYFAPAFVKAFCDEHEDQITAFLRRWESELEGEYDDVI